MHRDCDLRSEHRRLARCEFSIIHHYGCDLTVRRDESKLLPGLCRSPKPEGTWDGLQHPQLLTRSINTHVEETGACSQVLLRSVKRQAKQLEVWYFRINRGESRHIVLPHLYQQTASWQLVCDWVS